MNYTLPVTEDDGTIGEREEPICKRYYELLTDTTGSILQYVYDYLVVLVSFTIRNIMILLSSYIGFFSRTKETKFIMFSVF